MYLREQQRSPEQLGAGREGVRKRMQRRATVRRVRAIAAVAVLGLFGTGVWQRFSNTPETLASVYVATSEEKTIALPEGSTVRLQPGGELRVHRHAVNDIALEVARGEARFDATHREGRSFEVSAGTSLVRVVGTRFTVAKADTVVRVSVTEGAVMASDTAREPERVAAGEEWTNVVPEVVPPPEPEPEHASVQVKHVQTAPTPPKPTPPKPPRARPLGAGDILQDARAMAANDEVALAVELYRQLRKDFPRDPRAAGAMFEAGRLLQDRMRSFAESAEAYADALELQPQAPWREDAMARRIQVLELLHRASACEQERAQYLSEFPDGVHAPLVQRSCAWRK